jgi:hypothetical protein
MIIEKIISGGQSGADFAGLLFGKKAGIPTGGWAPKNWLTLDGPKPSLKDYGLIESSGGYSHRTGLNVRDSDGTVRFAENFFSAGEICTKKYIDVYKKLYLDISVSNPIKHAVFLKWLEDNKIKVLNVAGNSEQTVPGIGNFVLDYLANAFSVSL